MRKSLVLAILPVLLLGGVAEAKAKPFTKKVTFTDTTPDPTGNLESSEAMHCNGELPMEKPISVSIPADGSLKVALSGFQGDWTLQIRDSRGRVVGGADVNPPDTESATVKVKKGKYAIQPCNLAGTLQAIVTYTYKPR